VDYSTLSAEELALTCFRGGDEAAWTEFIRRFHPLISRVVLRIARQWGEVSPHVVEDLIQDTYVKICSERNRLLDGFTSSHADAIYGFIKVFTANLVHDHFKASRSKKRGGAALATSIDGVDMGASAQGSRAPEAVIQREVLILEVDACLESVSTGPSAKRDREIFWLYYRVGLAASAIAALPLIGLTTKGVESTLQRLTKQVRERLVTGKEKVVDPGRVKGIPSAESL
jgi:RNA polymerase sigma-70 factor (ECF subfamily)